MIAAHQSPMAIGSPALLDALLRNSPMTFIRKAFATLHPGDPFRNNWHINAIAWHLELVRQGRVKRLIITMPPRSLKSLSVSVAFPAFVHGHDPTRRIVCVSYGQELAAKLQNDYREVLGSDWYRRIFPNTRIGSKDGESEVTLIGGRGGRLATSVGGALTGRGGDIIIIDDPLKPLDAMSEPKRTAVNDWFGSTLLSRLNQQKTGAIIIVAQRVHADDLVGFVLETSRDDWTVLNLPAIALADAEIAVAENRVHPRKAGEVLHEELEPLDVLEKLRRGLGSEAFAAQYLQDPVPPGGNTFRREWLRSYSELPEREPGDRIMQSWDTAAKIAAHNDFSVCTTWLLSRGCYYLLDLIRGRFEFPELKARAIGAARQWTAKGVLVEDAGVGTGLIAELRQAGISAIAIPAVQSKQVRASVQTDKFESGRVLFPKFAPWLSELQAELLAFPARRHDDQVDSVVQMLGYEIPRVTIKTIRF
jgi:predicted phage terminase large subunit-like protein